jgi:hypothetical protein
MRMLASCQAWRHADHPDRGTERPKRPRTWDYRNLAGRPIQAGTDALRGYEPRRVVATFTGGRCWTGRSSRSRRLPGAGSWCGCACSRSAAASCCSPVRRAAPPTRPTARAAKPVTSTATALTGRVAAVTAGPLDRVTKLRPCGPVDDRGNLASRCATLPLRGAEPGTGPLKAGRILAPVDSALAPVASALAPVGSVLAPVGSALAPVTGPVAGLVGPVVPGGLLPLPLPGLGGSGNSVSAGPGTQTPAAAPTGTHGGAPSASVPTASQTYPARLAADGASSPATRSIRSWPALTGAVSLPGFPTSAELPAGGPDPLSTSSGAGFGLAALAAALVLLGPLSRGRARPERSGVLSRSYLPLVSRLATSGDVLHVLELATKERST